MRSKNYLKLLVFVLFTISAQAFAQVLPCNPPTTGTTTNITANSATLSWVAAPPAVIYNIRYRLQSQPNSPWITVTTQITNTNLSNLLCNTAYEWQIQSGCPGTNGGLVLSTFSTSFIFTTLACTNVCSVPTGLYTNNITSSSAKLHWNSTGAVSYRVRYRIVGAATWLLKYPTANNVTINGLTSAGLYEWQVRSKCNSPGGVVLSAWSNVSNFQTPGVNNCNAPTGLTSTNSPGSNAKLLAWNSTGASSYNIHYRPANTLQWITATSTTNSKTISSLQTNVTYEWQVQSVCIVNGTVILSPWSASAYFTFPSPVRVSPNPASRDMAIDFESDTDTQVTLTLSDFMGIPVFVEKYQSIVGTNTFQVNVSNLKNGMYYLVISGSEGQKASRFCIKN